MDERSCFAQYPIVFAHLRIQIGDGCIVECIYIVFQKSMHHEVKTVIGPHAFWIATVVVTL